MKTYTTDTGIKLLFPVVPKKTDNYSFYKMSLCCFAGPNRSCTDIAIGAGDFEILGTCWRENCKLVADLKIGMGGLFPFSGGLYQTDDFFTSDPNLIFDHWARREGIEIAEGEFMNVVLKVN